MRHDAAPSFWTCYRALPASIRQLADEAYDRLKRDPHYPSLHFKKVNRYWSARIGRNYRALAIEGPNSFVWFWIGTHAEYDKLVG